MHHLAGASRRALLRYDIAAVIGSLWKQLDFVACRTVGLAFLVKISGYEFQLFAL